MLDTSDPLVQIKITSAVCSFVAILTTVYRLYVRRGRMWIDDAWAVFALLTLFSQIAAVFMHLDNPAPLSKLSRVAAYYLMAIAFYCIIWASRISIIFSVIRIDPNPDRRRLYVGVSVVYFLTCVFLIVQLFWVCEPNPTWKNEPSPQCHLTLQVAICQLVSDVLADLFLLVAPLRVLMHLQDKALRKKLVIIFSTCVITTVVSLVHAVYILTTGGIKVIISALVEDCMSLIVANVPVVVTAVMRLSSDPDNRPPLRSVTTNGGVISTMMHFASRKFGAKDPNAANTTLLSDTDTKRGLRIGVQQQTVTIGSGGGSNTRYGRKSGGTNTTTTTFSGGTTTVDQSPIMLDLMRSGGSVKEEEQSKITGRSSEDEHDAKAELGYDSLPGHRAV